VTELFSDLRMPAYLHERWIRLLNTRA